MTSCGKSQPAVQGGCADSGAMSPSETSLRQANHYVEQSADAAKISADSTFFTPGASGSTRGSCQIYTGGAANDGRDDSRAHHQNAGCGGHIAALPIESAGERQYEHAASVERDAAQPGAIGRAAGQQWPPAAENSELRIDWVGIQAERFE